MCIKKGDKSRMTNKKIEVYEKRRNRWLALKFTIALLLAGLTAMWSIPYAFSVRGYFAVGGEYFLIMEMAALPWIFQGLMEMLMESIYMYTNRDD